MRSLPCCIKKLSLVACQGDSIVGHIMYSKAKVVSSEGVEKEVLCMGPITVDVSVQKKGIGSLLIKESSKRAAEMGYKAVIIYGHPAYYHRFGFASAEKYGISTSTGANFDAFMALELVQGGFMILFSFSKVNFFLN